MAHTPGPWVVQGQAVLSDRPYPEWKQIAEVRIGNADNWSDPEGESNARLIAAAPDLLALAKWVRDNMEPLDKDPSDGVSGWRHMDSTEVDSIVSGVLHFCDEAIAKAEVRSE